MIGFLRGKILHLAADVVLLDVGGVGYEAQISSETWRQLTATPNHGEAVVSLYIHTYVREDSLLLFGFFSSQEKEVFELLIGVSGVGPKLARAILSGGALGALVQALGSADVGTLQKIPGVGKKTAQRIVLELKEKVQNLDLPLSPEPAGGADRNVVSALVNLGYRPTDSERVVAELREADPAAGFEDLLRRSLARLARH
ncbi:MAG: Holliday junction branch migration protein RuvA [Acidobacteriota bacterium]